MKILLDTNVVVDVLQNRSPWCKDGQLIFRGAVQKLFTACMTSKEATDIHYLMMKFFKGQEKSDEMARAILTVLFDNFELLDTQAADCKNAVSSSCPDYEDAVMIETAVRAGVDCIITRNVRDFAASPLPVCTPSDFVQQYME